MIIDALLKLGGWLFLVLWWPLSFIPDGEYVFDKFGDALDFFLVRLYGWDFILPVSDALLILKISVIITYGISSYYAVLFIVRLWRGN